MIQRVACGIIPASKAYLNGGAFEQVNLLYGENPNKAVRAFTAPFKEAGIQTHMHVSP